MYTCHAMVMLCYVLLCYAMLYAYSKRKKEELCELFFTPAFSNRNLPQPAPLRCRICTTSHAPFCALVQGSECERRRGGGRPDDVSSSPFRLNHMYVLLTSPESTKNETKKGKKKKKKRRLFSLFLKKKIDKKN